MASLLYKLLLLSVPLWVARIWPLANGLFFLQFELVWYVALSGFFFCNIIFYYQITEGFKKYK